MSAKTMQMTIDIVLVTPKTAREWLPVVKVVARVRGIDAMAAALRLLSIPSETGDGSQPAHDQKCG